MVSGHQGGTGENVEILHPGQLIIVIFPGLLVRKIHSNFQDTINFHCCLRPSMFVSPGV